MPLTYGFALNASDNSEQFSHALHSVTGSGVCDYGGKFGINFSGGFTVTLSTGYAMVHGRKLLSDEPVELDIPPSSNYADRYDAIAAVADYDQRKVSLEVLSGIDLNDLRTTLEDGRDCIILYIVRVRRGATVIYPDNVTDKRADPELCGHITATGSMSTDAIRVYNFLQTGIDARVDALMDRSAALIASSDQAVIDLDAAISAKGSTAVGDVITSRLRPVPAAAWLLCDGSAVPVGYPELSAMLGGLLPEISHRDGRIKAYIYGGMPED